MKRLASMAFALMASSCHIVAGLEDAVEQDGGPASSSVSASGVGSGGTSGTSGAGGSGACNAYEPNDTVNVVVEIPAITTGEVLSIQASLHPGDVDWYRYHASDLITTTDPSVRFQVDVEGAEVCAFVKCDRPMLPLYLTCPAGYANETSGSLPGCCGPSGGRLQTFVVNCGGPNLNPADAARVYLRVTDLAGAQCEEYSLTYGYN